MKLVNRLGWAVAIACTVGLVASTLRVERWFGVGRAPRLTFDVDLPAASDDPRALPARVADALATRLRDRAPEIRFHGGGQLVVAVDGRADEAEVVRGLLTRAGRLEFYEVASDTEIARRWFQRGRNGELPAGVEAEADSWSHEPTGAIFNDYYLRAPTAEALDAAIAQGEPVPAGLRALHERIEPHPESERREPFLRTYLVVDPPALDGRDVESATVTYDQNTLRPEVLIRFTRDGASRFGELTAAITGRKLAIVLDDRVTSAPIVQTAIRGGVSTITMGGADARSMDREANDLVNVLRAGATLPDGMTASLSGAVPGAAGAGWVPRLVLALLAGLAAFFALPRLTRGLTVDAEPRARGTRGASRVAAAAALTLGLPLAFLLAGARLTLPGVNRDAFAGSPFSMGPSAASFGVFAIGLLAVVNGFWIAEAIAALAPRWRRRRLGSAADRRGIDRLAIALGLGLAAIQALLLVTYLHQLDLRGAAVVAHATTGTFALQVLTLIAGVAVLVVAADLITRHGLVNGYVAMLGVSAVDGFYRIFTRPPWPGAPDQRLALATALVVIALVMVVAASLRDESAARRRLPWFGLVPVTVLALAASVALLILQGLTIADGRPLSPHWFEVATRPPLWLDVGVALAVSVAIAGVPAARRWLATPRGLAVTVVVTAALIALRHLGVVALEVSTWVFPIVWLVGVAVDGGRAFRARLGLAHPVAILAVHDVDRADRAADALAAAGIPASVENLRVRALLRGLGAFAPIVVRVDRADAARALAAIVEAEAELDPHVAAFAG